MKDLQDILGEKEKETTKINQYYQNITKLKVKESEKRIKKEKDKLNKYIKSEETLLEKDKRKLSTQKINSISDIQEKYSLILVNTLYSNLTKDYSLLNNRNELDLTEEQIKEAQNLQKDLFSLDDPSAKEIAIKYMDDKKRKLLELDLSKIQEPIRSYISSDENNCYILSPIMGKNANDLEISLEKKLLDIADYRKISNGKRTLVCDKETEEVIKTQETINYKLNNIEFPNGFLMLTLETVCPKYLEKELISKFANSNIQPKKFQDKRLSHTIYPIEISLLKDFISNNTPKEKISLQDKLNTPPYKEGINVPTSQEKFNIQEHKEKNTKRKRQNKNTSPLTKNELIKEYEKLADLRGYTPSMFELSKENKELYYKIKKYEKQNDEKLVKRRQSRLPGKIQKTPEERVLLEVDYSTISSILNDIEDTEENKKKALKEFEQDFSMKEFLNFRNPGSWRTYRKEQRN